MSSELDQLRAEVEAHMGSCPGFFMVSGNVKLARNLWRQARDAYLDAPIPSLFKERLFTSLSRFCGVPYCISVHCAFLLKLEGKEGAKGGDGSRITVEDVVNLIEKPLADGETLEALLVHLEEFESPLEQWPEAGSADEDAIFSIAMAIFLNNGNKPRCLAGLRQALASDLYEALVALLSFIGTAHAWAEAHPELLLDEGVHRLLQRERALATALRDYSDKAAAALFAARHSEAAWLKSERGQLGQILEDSVNEIFIFDAETMRFVLVNRGARENLGYSRQEMKRLTPAEIKPAFTREQFDELIEPLRNERQDKLVFQVEHERKDGTRYQAEIHLQRTRFGGRPSFVAIALDITERLKAEEALRIHQAAINASSNGILITDARRPDDPIIFSNPAFYALTGYSEEETLGHNCRFLQGDDRDQPERAQLAAAIRDGKECQVVIRNYRKDGSMFWNELTLSPLRNERGELTHFISIQHDVTKRRQDEDERERLNQELDERVHQRTAQLEQAQDQLVRKEKLATLGQLAGSVAHEIRTPLSVIRNAAYFLEATVENPNDDAVEGFAEIKRALVSTNHIFEELLNYASDPKAEVAEFPIGDAIDGAMFGLDVPASVDLRLSLDQEGQLLCFGDPQQVSRILRNLMVNGIQAQPDGGLLEIACELKEPDRQQVIVSVSDHGVGMTEDQLGKIFEPLFTTKAKGIGLGLTLSLQYAELNQATLTAESTLGEGSTFRLTLARPMGTHDSNP